MKSYGLIFLILFVYNSFAQQSKYWGQLAPGEFAVGYQDTILFNADQEYSLGSYKGPKPYFISIWFPLDSVSGVQISFNDYFPTGSVFGMEALADSIRKTQEGSFVRHGVTNNLDSWDNDELTRSKATLAQQLRAEKLNVFKSGKYPAARFPTIVYHHGNSGIPLENFVLFEYLASHGYVVVSADYHWPGLRGRAYTQESDQSLDDVNFVARFSESLNFTDKDDVTFIGHSWGGGIALRLNQKQSPHFKRYIILDSTLEKAGLAEIKTVNPHLDSLFRSHSDGFRTETTVVTARGSYISEGKRVVQQFPDFLVFQFLDKEKFTLFTLNHILNHGSFTSLGVMRSVFAGSTPQTDERAVKEQFLNYQHLVRLIEDILAGTPTELHDVVVYNESLVKEDFAIFLYRFSTGKAFQQSRVQFPLEVIQWKDPRRFFMGTVVKNLQAGDWSHDHLFIKEALISQIYDNHEGRLEDTGERLIHLTGNKNGTDKKYFFSLMGNKWYLTRKVDLGQ